MDFSSLKLETTSLTLSSANRTYASKIFEAYRFPVTLYMNYPAPKSILELEERMAERELEIQKGQLVYLIVELKTTNDFVGVFAIEDIDTKTPEVGCWLKLEHHGKGYSKEALTALVEWAKSNLTFEYLRWPCAEKNAASCRLAERFGGRISKTYVKENLTGYTWSYREFHIPLLHKVL